MDHQDQQTPFQKKKFQVKTVGHLPEEEIPGKKGWIPSEEQIPGKNCWPSSRRRKIYMKWVGILPEEDQVKNGWSSSRRRNSM
jgi:hypothetical protein